MDKRIVELVSGSDFERRLYEAALKNLADTDNQLRFNNFAYAMRELSRHFLHRLAPSDEVTKCSWYKNITGEEGNLARDERAAYAVHGGLSEEYVQETLGLDITEMNQRLKKAIRELSKYTHIGEHVFDLPADKIDNLVQETTEAFAGLIEAIQQCRNDIIYKLHMAIDDAAVGEVLSNTIQELDELATHHCIDEIYVDSTDIKINHETVHFTAGGYISVELQYGSNSDMRRGDGARINVSFPFSCELICPVTAPNEDALELVPASLIVDTSKWYEAADEYEDVDTEQIEAQVDERASTAPLRPNHDEMF